MKKKLTNLSQKLGAGYLALNVGDFDIFGSPKTTGNLDPKNAVVSAIEYILFFIGVIAIVFVVWGGIQYITSGGDAEKTTKARNTLMYAILGIIIVVLAFLIVNWAAGTGANTLTN